MPPQQFSVNVKTHLKMIVFPSKCLVKLLNVYTTVRFLRYLQTEIPYVTMYKHT